jgi:hypothetical protein
MALIVDWTFCFLLFSACRPLGQFHDDLTTTFDDNPTPPFFHSGGDTQNLFDPPPSFDEPHPPFIPSPAPPTHAPPPVSFFQPQPPSPPRIPDNPVNVWSEPVAGPQPPFVPSPAPPAHPPPRPALPPISQLPPAPYRPAVRPGAGHFDPDPEPEPGRPIKKRPVKGRRPPKSKNKGPFSLHSRHLPFYG